MPYGVVQEALDPGQNYLEDGKAAAESFTGQEIPFFGDLGLFGIAHLVDVLDDLKRGIFGFQSLLFRLGLLTLWKRGALKNRQRKLTSR